VAGDVGHLVSEEREQAPAHVRRKFEVLHFGFQRRDELNAPVLGLEHRLGCFPHAADQVGETVSGWADGPDDIAQGGPQTARPRGCMFERLGSALPRLQDLRPVHSRSEAVWKAFGSGISGAGRFPKKA